MIECHFCNYTRPSVDGIKDHLRTSHIDEMVDVMVKSRALPIRCDTCGKKQKRPRYKISNRQYCDDDCRNKRGGKGSVAYERQQKELARERDGHTCQDCGVHQRNKTNTSMALDVHHIKRPEEFDNPNDAHELPNLITLCRSCHIKREPRNEVKET